MINDKIKETENSAVYSFDGSISMRLCGVFADSVKFLNVLSLKKETERR